MASESPEPVGDSPNQFSWQNLVTSSSSKDIQTLEKAVDAAFFHGRAFAEGFRDSVKDARSIQNPDSSESQVPSVPELETSINQMSSESHYTLSMQISTDGPTAIYPKEHQEFRVLVGVAGATGAGKTSLLNSLLEKKDMLPSSDEKAATATVCEIAWNHDMSTEYRAVVTYRSYANIKEELDRFFKDLKYQHTRPAADESNDEDGDADPGPDETNIDNEIEKLCKVWGPHTEMNLLKMTADKILKMSHPANACITKGTEVITSNNSDSGEFAKEIAPYLDSKVFKTTQSGKVYEYELWPLIERVELYLRAPILRNGVVLVDLPGLGDAVEGRAQVAESYRSRLDSTSWPLWKRKN